MFPLKPPFYSRIPDLENWKKDSHSHDYAKERNSDPAIHRIDQFISSLQVVADDGQRKYMLCELFFTTNYWLNHPPDAKEREKPGRRKLEAAVWALKEVVQKTLAAAFRVAYGMVPELLSRNYDCPLSAHGIYVDAMNPVANGNFEKFMVHFKDGKAMQFNWRNPVDRELQPLSTRKMISSANKPQMSDEGFAFFVMTRYRDLYVAPFGNVPEIPKYHSTIPNKDVVQCAGSILIEEGVVKGICSDSGHYKPGDTFFINVLEQLKVMGVELKGIKLCGNENGRVEELPVDGREYLALHGNWDEIARRNATFRDRMRQESGAMRGLRHKKRFDELKRSLSEDKALDRLLAEQFWMMNQAGRANWTQIWNSVLDALFDVGNAFKSEDPTFFTFIYNKRAQYKIKPPDPPAPKPPKLPPTIPSREGRTTLTSK